MPTARSNGRVVGAIRWIREKLEPMFATLMEYRGIAVCFINAVRAKSRSCDSYSSTRKSCVPGARIPAATAPKTRG